jgi:hypothetical protein
LSFEIVADPVSVFDCRVLIPITDLVNCLANTAIDPVSDFASGCQDHYQTRVEIGVSKQSFEPDRVVFRVLTSFADADMMRDRLSHSRSSTADRFMLSTFGARFTEPAPPSPGETHQGFKAMQTVSVLTGFVPRRNDYGL